MCVFGISWFGFSVFIQSNSMYNVMFAYQSKIVVNYFKLNLLSGELLPEQDCYSDCNSYYFTYISLHFHTGGLKVWLLQMPRTVKWEAHAYTRVSMGTTGRIYLCSLHFLTRPFIGREGCYWYCPLNTYVTSDICSSSGKYLLLNGRFF